MMCEIGIIGGDSTRNSGDTMPRILGTPESHGASLLNARNPAVADRAALYEIVKLSEVAAS